MIRSDEFKKKPEVLSVENKELREMEIKFVEQIFSQIGFIRSEFRTFSQHILYC